MKFHRQSFSFLKGCLLTFSLSLLFCSCMEDVAVSYVGDTVAFEDVSYLESVQIKGEHQGENTVFWTDSGKVWHIKSECGSLKNAEKINNGSIDKALEAGKERVCKKCSK